MTYASNPDSPPPSPEKLKELGQFTEDAMKSGLVLMTGGLVRPTTGTRVRMSSGKFSITDAPLPETKELIDGFALVQVNSKEEAVAVARSFMEVAGDGEGEILQVFDPGGPPR
ncbi:MAG TPA: YciI family protein [Polyangiaceae bacterium]